MQFVAIEDNSRRAVVKGRVYNSKEVKRIDGSIKHTIIHDDGQQICDELSPIGEKTFVRFSELQLAEDL